jgi:hypothetical protein
MIVIYMYRSKRGAIREFCVSFKFNNDNYVFKNMGWGDGEGEISIIKYPYTMTSADIFITTTECSMIYPPLE